MKKYEGDWQPMGYEEHEKKTLSIWNQNQYEVSGDKNVMNLHTSDLFSTNYRKNNPNK